MVHYNYKQADTIENLVEKTWLCRYPRPTIITYDCGNKFLGHAFKNDVTENEYRIKAKCATTANAKAISTLEIIHQITANLIRVFDLQNNYLNEDGPWSGILSATYFAVRST